MYLVGYLVAQHDGGLVGPAARDVADRVAAAAQHEPGAPAIRGDEPLRPAALEEGIVRDEFLHQLGTFLTLSFC